MEQRTAGQPAANPNRAHLEELVQELRELEDRLRQGGGADKIERQHGQGKLTARERVARLLDPHARFQEVGLLVAYDEYNGQAPAAGVVTGFGIVAGREVVVVANDATVKAGSWWPDDQENAARSGDRHALPRADYLSGRFGRREFALSGRRLSRAIRRGADFLLQLDYATLPESPADRGGDGTVRRG